MATGFMTMAVMLLALDAAPADVVPMNSRSLQIPIRIDPAQRHKIKEIILFTSTDQGLTWNQSAVVAGDKDAFVFFAPTDGLYWFNICVVDAKGSREPPDIFKSPPQQKVLVDTLKPNVRIVAAQRQGDEIAVAWEIQEDHPDLGTLKLEYRAPDAPTWMWYTASITPGLTGQARFRFVNSGPALVRLQLADQAGNVGVAQTELTPKDAGTTNTAASLAATGANPPLATSLPQAPGGDVALPPSLPSQSGQPGAGAERLPPIQPASLPQADARQTQRSAVAPPPNYAPPAVPPNYPVANGNGPDAGQRHAANLANGEAMAPERTWAAAPGSSQPPAAYGADNRYVTPAAYMGNQYSMPAPSSWPHAPLGPVQITNSTQVTLDYEVNKVGPSGIGSVELYLTHDEGRTWQRYANDPDLKPPMTVNLPGEGVYGLRLVVRSRAGLGQRPPQAGDAPQMRIEVDTTPPLAKLFPPQPDPRRRDALLLTWNASDQNLATNPITLQWAERSDGPWQTIAADLTNSGRYTWQLSPNLPYRVFLRVVARDTAGNVGMDMTLEPVLIDLHEPEGQIKGIIAVGQR